MEIVYTSEWFKKNAKHFDKWFDKETFMWKCNSDKLARFCIRNFDKWWDPDLFWVGEIGWLCKFGNHKFDIWFDHNSFDWRHNSLQLARYCSDHFDKWYDPELFNWGMNHYLSGNCMDKKHIWGPDFEQYKLFKEMNRHID
jgi:hypothetical protein